MSKDEFSNYRADMSERWQEEQYNTEGSNEWEAIQSEEKHSPGLMKKQ